MARSYLERVVVGEERGLVSWLIRALLWPLSVVYRIGLAAYLSLYGLGLRRRHRLGVPVICVGNLTFGGTGKTPAVQTICRMLRESGRNVVILSRGHGGSLAGCVIVSDGERVLRSAEECGDEPVLLARTLPGIPVIVGKDRRVSGELAVREFGPDAIVLDDGMQYWQLHRDMDIVVMDAARPFGSGFVMPMGDLREPASGLRRAGAVILNGADGPAPRVERIARDALIFRARRVPATVTRVSDGADMGLDWLAGRGVLAFCVIGNPASFAGTLRAVGAVVNAFREFPDHHPYSAADLSEIETACASAGAEAVVTTEKDWARLGPDIKIDNLYVLGIRLEIEGLPRLGEHITQRIDGAHQEASAEEAAH